MPIYHLLTAIGLVLWVTQMHCVVRDIRQHWSRAIPAERYRLTDESAVERGFIDWLDGLDLPDVDF